ncbi:hypothetical protein Tco_1363700 [Tanacetum coccineum]
MAWRHHDASIADPFPKPSEYNEQDAARLREVAISLHKPYNSLLYVVGLSLVWKESGHVPILKGPKGEVLTMAEFLRLPDLHGSTRLKDIPPKTVEMETAEVACRKVLTDREKKKRNTKAKAAATANGNDDVHQEGVVGEFRASLLVTVLGGEDKFLNKKAYKRANRSMEKKKRNTKAKAAAKADGNDDVHQEGVVGKKRVGGVGAPRKKRETHIGTPLVDANSEQVSSSTPINYSDDVPSSPAQRPPLRARMRSSPKLCLRAFE